MSTLQRRLHDGEKSAGWDPDNANTFAEEIAHLHEEVSEAFRAWRKSKDVTITFAFDDGKPTGVPVELADVAIGMFYMAERWGFDLLDAIELKHQWNLGRSYADEGRRLHEPAPDPEARRARRVGEEGLTTSAPVGDDHPEAKEAGPK
jgi:NTP pyrophosphatase (non-canonical NTP hydrolase)